MRPKSSTRYDRAMTTATYQDRGHRRRRHRQGSHSGRPGRHRSRHARHRRLALVHRVALGLRATTCSHGRMMDEDGFERLATFDAIYLGAIGVADACPITSPCGDLLLPLRQRFDQYVNLRPMRLLPGLASPLANRGAADIDMVCVRENSEGEYAGVGGRIHVGTPHEVAEQTGLFTRHGIERILRYGFELAAKRPRKLLASATKSNALRHAMVLWDEVAEIVRQDYPGGRVPQVPRGRDRRAHGHASADARRASSASNLFGDILTDIGSAISGQPRHRAGREHQPRADVSVDVRADSRIGAGHRRQGDRQPDRRDLGRRADARSSRAGAMCTTASSARSSASSPAADCARPISAERRRRKSSPTRSPGHEIAIAGWQDLLIDDGDPASAILIRCHIPMLNDAHCHFFSTPFFSALGGDAAISALALGPTGHGRRARGSLGRGARSRRRVARGADRERAWRRRPRSARRCGGIRSRFVGFFMLDPTQAGRRRDAAAAHRHAPSARDLPVSGDAPVLDSGRSGAQACSRSRPSGRAPWCSCTAACCRSACARSSGCRARSTSASATRSISTRSRWPIRWSRSSFRTSARDSFAKR